MSIIARATRSIGAASWWASSPTARRAAAASSETPPLSVAAVMCPSTTCASVTVGRVPPRPNAAGPGTAPALWGFPGTDSQHTFFQWLHQGSDIAPVEFILCLHPEHTRVAHHRWLVANCLAQRELLAHGYRPPTGGACPLQGLHPGGRPSLLTVLPRLDAQHLGALLALAEHKVFLQSVLWGINAFDQPGVDHGKRIARTLVGLLKSDSTVGVAEASTSHWLHQFAPHTRDPETPTP